MIENNSYLQKVEDILLKNTIQLYYSPAEKEPKHYGSGVLFRHLNRHFILTASHMLWGGGKVISANDLAIKEGVNIRTINRIEIVRSNFKTNNTIQRKDDDEIDIAVIELTQVFVKIIQPQYDFITIAELGINHCFRLDKEYLICGYPTYRTSLNDTKKEEKHAGFSGFTKIISQARLDKVKLRPQQIGLNRLKIINCETKTKASKFEFNGISGCGLWYLRNFDAVQNQKIEKYLVGLMVYDEKTKNILIATKIDMVSELLRQIFNMYDIPKSIINTTIDI